MPREHQLQGFVVFTGGRLSTLGFTKERAKSSRGAFSQLASKVHMTSFTGFSPRPSSQEVSQGIIQAFRSGAEAIVAIGGGSSIDMGKAIDVGLHDSEIQDALSQLETIGDEATISAITQRLALYLRGEIPFDDVQKAVPLVSVTTTAGTGSEGTVCAVITDSSNDNQKLFINGSIVPDYIILDPELILTLPEALTRWSGLDAFVQNIEAFIARSQIDNNDVPGGTQETRA